MYEKQKELIERFSKKAQIPEEQAAIIQEDFWKGIREYLVNPTEIEQKGIMIQKFITIKFKERRIAYDISKEHPYSETLIKVLNKITNGQDKDEYKHG